MFGGFKILKGTMPAHRWAAALLLLWFLPCLSHAEERSGGDFGFDLDDIVPIQADEAPEPSPRPSERPEEPAQTRDEQAPPPARESRQPTPTRALPPVAPPPPEPPSRSRPQEAREIELPEDPLQVRSIRPLESVLRSAPNERATGLRRISETDSLETLRTRGEWAEVDLTTAEGLKLRGWVKTEPLAPIQREIPEIEQAEASPAQSSLLESSRYFWIGSGKIEEMWNLRVLVGYVSLSNRIGGQSLSSSNSPIDYSFGGFSLQVDSELGLLETTFWDKEFRWLMDLRYRLGFFQVEFSNSVAIPADLRGSGYNVRHQSLRALQRADWRVLYWNSGFYRLGLGAGFFFAEIAPDLKRTVAGNVVFTSLTWMGPVFQFDHQLQIFDRFRISNAVAIAAFPQVSESPNVSLSGEMKASGMPMIMNFGLEYRWTRVLSLQASAEFFLAQAKHSGVSDRIGESFESVKMRVSTLQAAAGVGLHF